MLELISRDATHDDLRAIAANPANTGVQFLNRPSRSLLAAVNQEIFATRPDIGLSVSSWYGGFFELSILAHLPALRRLRLTHAGDPPKNLHQVCALRDLLSLSLGESGLTDYTFLSQLPTSLEDLSLAEAPRGKRSFTFLSRLKGLRTLTLIGHAADVEVVGELARLRQLNFQSVSPTSLRFLVDLPELRALRLALGGLRSLDGLEDLARLEYLHIWQVRHLDDLAAVAELEALETLFLQALRNVKSLPPLARLTRLKTVWLDTMTRLRDFRGIAQAPNLSNFTFIAATNCRPSDFTPLLRHPTLQTMRVGFGSRRTNDTFQAMMAAAGKREPEPRSQGSVGVQPHN